MLSLFLKVIPFGVSVASLLTLIPPWTNKINIWRKNIYYVREQQFASGSTSQAQSRSS